MFIFLKFSKFLMAILKKMKINKKEMRSDKNIIIIFSIKISQQQLPGPIKCRPFIFICCAQEPVHSNI
jgi:hypothetical protein